MSELKGFKQLVDKLKTRSAKAIKDTNVDVVIGYTQAYAIYVHENMKAKHPVGEAKFLEKPYRQLQNDGTLGEIMLKAIRAGRTFAESLMLAGLRVQRESQLLVPVDTGALKGSAFTRLERK